MGTVHRGVDRQLRRIVAVKLLSSQAEAVAVNSQLRRAEFGWSHSYVAVFALLALTAL
ncbi:hypothetical protein ACFY1U_11045 [Streptomyces sp. NPDC001351]|uniref:hypothetical protein n=1 Tax=Streptomyces sp. NPDC001351 TaxID=3364564 RepID=UPI0036C2E4EE